MNNKQAKKIRRQAEREIFIATRKMEMEARARYTLDLNFMQSLPFKDRFKIAWLVMTRKGYKPRMEELRQTSNKRKLTSEELQELRTLADLR